MFHARLCTGLILAALCVTPVLFSAPGSIAAPAATKLDGKTIKGKVLETMNTGGYTYLQVKTPEQAVWIAIPETKVEKGQQVTCKPGMTMTNFESKTLGRTFDIIVFSSGLNDADKTGPSNPHATTAGMGGNPAMGDSDFAAAMQAEQGKIPAGSAMTGGAAMGGAMAASGGSTTAIVPSKDITVDKAKGENAYTVGECFKEGKKLNNKKIKVRGKVVKVSRMIMGKNWIHIQDGSGNPMKNTHDLVVTTMAEPAMNSLVLVEGTLHADKDFGAGYKYKVIIEDAEIKK
jgi:hypothetical protein